jgi:uncharacterized protein (DUF1800 family)
VYDAAECFTGWTVNDNGDFGNYGDFMYRNDRHSQGEKRIFQSVIPAVGGESDDYKVMDLVANHPGTARYVCRKLCRRLIMDNPPESLVSQIADVFMAKRDEPDQLKQVVRAVIMSDEFRNTFGEKIKPHYEMAVSAFRATMAVLYGNQRHTTRILDYLQSSGQGLFRHPIPDGFSDHKEDWLSTNPIMSIWRFMINAVEDSNEDVRHIRIEEATPATVRSSEEIVDYWANRILGRSIPEGEREGLVEFMANGRSSTMDTLWDSSSDAARRLPITVALILLSPTNFLR